MYVLACVVARGVACALALIPQTSEKKGMLESRSANPPEDPESVARRGPGGALLLCGIAVAIVVAIWFAFYFFAFLPRGIIR